MVSTIPELLINRGSKLSPSRRALISGLQGDDRRSWGAIGKGNASHGHTSNAENDGHRSFEATVVLHQPAIKCHT